jgi:hypothetical protein
MLRFGSLVRIVKYTEDWDKKEGDKIRLPEFKVEGKKAKNSKSECTIKNSLDFLFAIL